MAASVALTTPTLIATFVHLDVFDFSRWQAVAWVVLFVAAPPFWTAMLIVNRASVPTVNTRVRWPTAIALLALACPAGALVAGLRSLSDLSPPGARWAYLFVLALTSLVFGIWLLQAGRRRESAQT